MTAPLVELKGVVVEYAALEGAAAPRVLAGVDLEVRQGEAVAIVGPSGSGKSTLLHIIGGLLPPTQGSALLAGRDLASMSPDELAAVRSRSIGLVFQQHHLMPQLSALENVLVPTLVLDKGKRAEAVDRARSLLDGVGLGDRLGHRPAQLSGGECQRVAVVRALINGPPLLLADEPTGSLDQKAADHLGSVLCDLNERESVALVVVTHSVSLAARMQRALELRDGVLSALGVGA